MNIDCAFAYFCRLVFPIDKSVYLCALEHVKIIPFERSAAKNKNLNKLLSTAYLIGEMCIFDHIRI